MTNPSWSLREIFGDGIAFVPVPCFEQQGWLFADRLGCDVLTGNQLVLVDDVLTICHRDAATPRVLELLRDAGHRAPRDIRTYASQAEYETRLLEVARSKLRIVVNHAQAAPLERLWIPDELLRALNDKANLARMVPPHALPQRRCVPAAELALLRPRDLPIVVKISSPESSGAGYGVRVCESPGQLEDAIAHFATASAVVLEEKLGITGSWCVQFVVTPDGTVHPLGAAEQVIAPNGSWCGNWVDGDAPAEVGAVAASVADAAAALGYRGVVGVDTATCADGRTLVLDVNCRFNGSTVALLLRDGFEGGVVRSRGWWFDGPFAELDRLARRAHAAGHFLPTSAWDPPRGRCRVTGLLSGTTRDEVDAHLAELKLAGFR